MLELRVPAASDPKQGVSSTASGDAGVSAILGAVSIISISSTQGMLGRGFGDDAADVANQVLLDEELACKGLVGGEHSSERQVLLQEAVDVRGGSVSDTCDFAVRGASSTPKLRPANNCAMNS